MGVRVGKWRGVNGSWEVVAGDLDESWSLRPWTAIGVEGCLVWEVQICCEYWGCVEEFGCVGCWEVGRKGLDLYWLPMKEQQLVIGSWSRKRSST